MVHQYKISNRRSNVEGVIKYWRLLNVLCRTGRYEYQDLVDKIRALGMRPKARTDARLFAILATEPFLRIPDEDSARRALEKLNDVEVYNLFVRLEAFSRSYDLIVIRDALAMCHRQIRHRGDWAIYSRIHVDSNDEDDEY